MRHRLWLLPIFTLGLFLWFWSSKIYWGTLDDAYHWELAHQILPFVRHALSLIQLDLASGMFRPIYTIYMMIGYRLFEENPQIFYVLNWVLLIAVAFAMARVFLKALAGRNRAVHNERQWAALLVAGLFAFRPWTQLFAHLSLQEKLGLFIVPLILWLMILCSAGSRFNWLRLLALDLALVALLCSKATFIAYGPPLVLISLLLRRRSWQTEVVNIILIFTMAGAFFLSIRTGYTAHYSFGWGRISGNLLKAHFATMLLWLYCITIIGTAFFRFLVQKRVRGLFLETQERLEAIELIGACGILTFSVVIAPWALGDYYLSPFVP